MDGLAHLLEQDGRVLTHVRSANAVVVCLFRHTLRREGHVDVVDHLSLFVGDDDRDRVVVDQKIPGKSQVRSVWRFLDQTVSRRQAVGLFFSSAPRSSKSDWVYVTNSARCLTASTHKSTLRCSSSRMIDAKCCVYPNVTTTMAAAAKNNNRLDRSLLGMRFGHS